ncbi:MAG TPA: NAD-binding protein, partial [Negativicutes bacterium]|nr:NAD-binding protein [Negativicutes bacterium]
MDLSGKRVLVMGAGISGVAVAKIAKRLGAQVALSDTKPEG